MRIVDIEYTRYLQEVYASRNKVRKLGDCTIWSAGSDPPMLVLDDPVYQRAAVFEYDTLAEREQDIRLVLRITDDDGDAGAGVPAALQPSGPIRSAEFAEPLPRTTYDDRQA